MKATLKILIYAAVIVLFVTGSLYLIKTHPEVQFAFYIPGIALLLYTIIYDDLVARPPYLAALRSLRAAKGK